MRFDLLDLAHRLAEKGEPFVLATVVRREAPTSARLGDAAIITSEGLFEGWLGGACTKDVIIAEAAAALEHGAPRLVVLTADPSAERRNGVRVLPMTCHSGGSVEVYLDPQVVPDYIVLFGASDVAESVARLSPELGFRVRRASTGPDGVADVDPATHGHLFAVIATYGEGDEEALRQALALAPAYVALVSGRRRFDAIKDALLAAGLDAEALARVSSPAGLDIGAKTPAEIAVSILAEIVQFRRQGRIREAAADDEAAAEAIDPVCGMTVSSDSASSAEHDGTTIYFCCEGCRQKFRSAPESFTTRRASR